MTSKEALEKLNFQCIMSNDIDDKWFEELKIIEKDLEILEIIKRKGVAIGFIQLLIKENAGGVNEYNQFIGGNKKLYLSDKEFKLIQEWLEK